jgi:L-seryl-tRNA(Ser) seleniumtransferase
VKEQRLIPSVDSILRLPAALPLIEVYSYPLVLAHLREYLQELRVSSDLIVPDAERILGVIAERIDDLIQPSLAPVINATGVILHTNLGRAPLSAETLTAMQNAARSYNTLEYDLSAGARGSRQVHCERLITRLSGAEAALVVNNNAAAVLLVLSALLKGKSVAVARSQLVEIGGSFRIPDVMRQSGARMLEIGTTNQVHLSDYTAALQSGAAAIIHVHSSNFKIIGFTSQPEIAELAGIARAARVPLVDDLGSGTFLDTAAYGMQHEPTVPESIAAGADLVCFSGDKLLGGPQAGIIAGRAELIRQIKKHPLARVLRADKLTLAGLAATLTHYLLGEAEQKIPIWKMISMPLEVTKERALYWKDQLGAGEVVAGESTVGGGSLPGETLPTWLLALTVRSLERFMKELRSADIPVIARVAADQAVFDPRTVQADEDGLLLETLSKLYPAFKKES